MAPIILGNASSIGNVSNIIVPYKDQYRISTGGVGGVAIGNTVNSSVFSTGTVIIAGTNLTINTSAVGAHQYLNLSIADPAAAANYVQGGDYISLSTGGIGTTISVTGLQPAGAYITTAALSDHNHGGTAFATGNIGGTIGTYTTASATGSFYGWSLSIPDFLVTAAELNHTHSIYAGTGTSTGTTSGTDIKLTANTAGISLRTPRYLTTAANISHIHGNASGTNITIGSSSNGLALSVGNYITTAAPVTHIHGSISTVSTTGAELSYTSASNGLTLGIPQWITTAAGGNNLTLAGNTAGILTEMNSGTVTIIGGDNITLSQSGNAFTIIGAASGTNAGIAFSMSNSNTTGTKVLVSTGTLYIEGGNNITVSQNSNTLQIIGNTLLTNVAGIGTTTNSTTGTDLKVTLGTDGLNLGVPQWITAATLSATASNSVYAGDYISLSTNGINTTISAVGLQATSNMSLYQQTSNNSLFLGTADGNNFVNTAFSTLLQHVSDNSLSLATSQSSLFQLTAHNSNSLGTTYTSHTHSNLYIALSESSLYRTSVLSNNFAVTSHTHSNLYLPVSASTAYQTSILDNTFALTNHSHSQYLTTAMLSNYTSAFDYTSHTSAITSNAVHSSQLGSVIFASSLNTNATWTSTYSGSSTYIGVSVNTVGGTAVGGAALQGSGTYTQNSGTIRFANSNGITFGLTNNQMTASVGNNAGSMYFNDTNGVTFGISSNTNNQSTITASIANYLTTAALSNHTHSQYLTTALATNYTSHTHNYAATSHTHNYMGTGISTSGNITVTANTAGLSMTAPTLGYL